ncbi:MAG: hypothetical protein QOG10_5872 [Kribbellaceae bacterium]|jgi:hypothetical protein|nr:hypothetical protein [Kribbellaceae bacterium]
MVFPVWGEYAGPRGYSVNAKTAELAEQANGPTVSSLVATNTGDRPLLMLEGQVLEGGWQNRLLGRSVLVPAGTSLDLEVVCVEKGRWGGGRDHAWNERRASLRVRSGLNTGEDRQGEVWRRVTEYDARYGPNATSSFAVHADRAVQDVRRLVDGLGPLPGQVGVVIGIAGQPVLAEVFDSPITLAQQFRSIVKAAALDALGQEELVTPSRRARRFVDRAGRVERRPIAPAGLGTTVAGADGYATVAALAWRRRDVHFVATNPRHALNLVRSH